jgi:hypothetical protein
MDTDPDFVPYSQRPEWSDVVPAEAAPGDHGSVVAVKYDKHDKELLGYFNACVAKVCFCVCGMLSVWRSQNLPARASISKSKYVLLLG